MEHIDFWSRFARHIRVIYAQKSIAGKPHRRIEFQLPRDPKDRADALAATCPCATCGAPVSPVRSRAHGGRSADTGHYISVACDLRTNMGCARSSKSTNLLNELIGATDDR